jgi:REP element-mobilizing transposase RayT
MAGNHSEVFLHFVWTTYGRNPIITPAIERRLYRYISGICSNLKCQVLAINGMPDHVHFAITFPTTVSIEDAIRAIKGGSSTFARETLVRGEFFGWRDGYGVFSFGRSDIDAVVGYIRNQKNHHADGTLWPEFEKLDAD